MRAFLAAIGLVFVFAGWAEARCTGKDLFAELERDDPAAARALLAQARQVPNGEGRFWRVETEGVPPSYLFGTFHVSDLADRVPAAVWQALEGSRVAVFEVTLADEQELERRAATDPDFVMDADAPPFSERMSPEDRAKVAAVFEARGLRPAIAEKLQAWMQISLVTFPPCQLIEINRGAKMLDVELAEHARDRGIPERGLERAAQALESLTTLPPDDVTRILISAGRSSEFEVDLFITNLNFYHSGRIALIKLFNDWMAERHMPDLDLTAVNDRMLRNLLDGRNAKWTPALLAEVGKGNAFVAVGALHLTGEAGLIAVLERAGFTATRLD